MLKLFFTMTFASQCFRFAPSLKDPSIQQDAFSHNLSPKLDQLKHRIQQIQLTDSAGKRFLDLRDVKHYRMFFFVFFVAEKLGMWTGGHCVSLRHIFSNLKPNIPCSFPPCNKTTKPLHYSVAQFNP